MLKLTLLLCIVVLFAAPGSATIIVMVGTSDGILACEDTQLTLTIQMPGQPSLLARHEGYLIHKLQPHGSFGFSTSAGDLTGFTQPILGGPKTVTYDTLEAIRSFFESNDIREFDPLMESQFQSRLATEIRKKPVSVVPSPASETLIFLYWVNRSGEQIVYTLDFKTPASALSYPASLNTILGSPRPSSRYIPLTDFANTKPKIEGAGKLVYDEMVLAKRDGFSDFRQDPELSPFLTDFVDAASMDSLRATRAIKKMIRTISEMQFQVDSNIGVGRDSDCLLLSKNVVRDMNQEIANADEQDAIKRKQAEAEAQRKALVPAKPTKKRK